MEMMYERYESEWKKIKPAKNPKAVIEMLYRQQYLQGKGYSLNELATLAEEKAKKLRIEASQHASLKLEELESRARLLTRIHDVTDSSWKSYLNVAAKLYYRRSSEYATDADFPHELLTVGDP